MRNTSERSSRHSPRQAAFLAGLVVLVVGFGVMAALSATGRWDVGRSMWHYRAATWGDIVLVPGICAVLAAGLCDSHISRQRSERIWAILGAAVFGLSGALVQASWLASDQPILNWTLPEPHHFSFPGWYHAVYLVLLSSAIGAAGLVLARRVRSAPAAVRDYVASSPATATLVGFSISFGLVLYLDSVDSLDTSAGQGSALGALGAALAAFALLLVVVGPKRSLKPLVGGLAIVAVVFVGTLLTHGFPG
jgi:hypothetical protein